MRSEKLNIRLSVLVLPGLFLVMMFNLYGQSRQLDIAHPGPDKIYIDLGIALVNKLHPQGRITGYRVDRKGDDDSGWQQLAVVRLPESQQEYLNRLTTIIGEGFPNVNISEIPVDSLWNRVEKYYRLDSLGFWSGLLIMRLALGSIYSDVSAIKSDKNIYRVSTVDSSDEIIASVESVPVRIPGIYQREQLSLSNKSASENTINITWSSSAESAPIVIRIFKSEGSSTEFDPINPTVLVFRSGDSTYYSISDTLVKADTYYSYYAIPEDYYGNAGNRTENVIAAASDFSQNGFPYIVQAAAIDSIDAIQISWVLKNRELVNHLEIFRSEYYDSGFVKIGDVPAGDSVYLDYAVKPMQKYEYYLRAVSMLGLKSAPSVKTFAMIRSFIPPAPPTGLTSEALKNGVKLQWENTEDFVEGFWVYRSSSDTGSLELVSPLVSENKPFTVYYDTTGLSGRLVYSYSVRSSSTSHILSDFTDTIYVRPDIKTIPPSPLELIASMNTDSTIMLSWFDMTSVDSSTFGYNVFRRSSGSGSSEEFIQLNDTLLPFTQNSFIDINTEPGSSYQYKVVTADVFGASSDPSIVNIDYPFPIPVPVIGLMVTSSEAGIELTWDESLQKGITQYNVYRQTRNSNAELLGSVRKGSEMHFNDNAENKGSLYFYYVTALNKYGKESEPGSIISIIP